MNRIVGCVTAVLFAVTVTSCSDSGPETPGLDRIDGPAQVDPSFDPFATVAPTTSAGSVVTDGGG